MSNFWNNLVPLRGRLSHAQLAGWEPSCVHAQGLGCRIEARVMIPLRDGIRLEADIYFPCEKGKYPAIVQLASYNKALHTTGVPKGTNEIGSPPVITGRGYVQVVVNARGIGYSEGELQRFQSPEQIMDFRDCIEWAAEQPWCTGDVCLFGTSYYGMTQPMVAALRPKGLKAFFANEICTDYFRHLWFHAGTFNNEFASLWMGANFKDKDIKQSMPPLLRAIISQFINRPWLWKHVMRKRIDRLYDYFISQKVNKTVLSWFCEFMLEGKNRQEITRAMSSGSYDGFHKIDVPFVVVQNLAMWNLHNYGSYDLFEKAATAENKKYMILGEPEYELPVLSWQLEALAFFDHIVRKTENGYDQLPRVRYWVHGRNNYAASGSFPVKDSTRLKLYLSGVSRQMEAMIPAEHSEAWSAIPFGAKVLPGTEEMVPQVLEYHFKAERDMTLAGPVTMNMRLSSNEIDTFVIASLSKNGVSASDTRILSMGAISAARRRVNEKLGSTCEIAIDYDQVDPLTPYKPVTLRFSLTPSAVFLKKGETVTLKIGSRTDLLKGKLQNGYVHMNLAVPPYFSKNTLHFGSDTYLEVDLVERPDSI